MDLPRGSRQVGRKIRANANWLLHAKPEDYLIAAGAASSHLPVIGRYLEPVGGMAALSVWGARYLPDMMSSAKGPRGPGESTRRANAPALADLVTAGLCGVVSGEALARRGPIADCGTPWRTAGRQRRFVHRASVPYGDEPGQLLDVWRRDDLEGPAPVLVFVPGGAWVIGSRVLQGHALMAHLAEQGWVCVSLQYRTSPRYRWPRQIIDVKTAIAWTRANVDQFGGDRTFVAVAGCSAGGHMASLAGLVPDEEQWQAAVTTDCSVDAVVSLYGRYDWEDRSTPERARFMDFLERVVVKRPQRRKPEVFRDASPVARVHAQAPPFLVIHGDRDGIIPVGEARHFVERLRGVSASPVCYLELPGAGHGFDLTDGTRTSAAVRAIGLFLNHIHRSRLHSESMLPAENGQSAVAKSSSKAACMQSA
ncbi:alpha/beta hydrolase [Mycobacterium sp. 2YAF39]|uniref:alpha/beta hydrolase n=1 Tax=Mycobacterium sp. 2YAF39 TaxID=3233033 RepID=UPI003F9B2A8C